MKLFISYTGLLKYILSGEVTWEDLDKELFYFGCARSHIMDRPPPTIGQTPVYRLPCGEWIEALTKQGKEYLIQEYCDRLREAVLKAEQEGRCAWREESKGSSWVALEELLTRHQPLPKRFYKLAVARPMYCYSGVENALRGAVKVYY